MPAKHVTEPEELTPKKAPSDNESNSLSSASPEMKIHTIPEKFYSAASRARVAESKKEAPKSASASEVGTSVASGSGQARPAKRKRGMGGLITIVSILLVLGIGGGFVYFNKSLIFPESAEVTEAPTPEEPPKPPAPPPPPSAPSNLSATATSPGVIQLSWTDTSTNEAGFRVERREPTSSYAPLTSLPPNSSAYQDRSVQPERTYLYRIIALNSGGESPASNEGSVDTPAPPPPPPESIQLPPAGLDSDSDGLTDLEEPLYGTDIRDPDADDDSFLDGNEVFHLYNPAGTQGQLLLESNLVKIFDSPVGWSFNVPTNWTAERDNNGLGGRVLTGNGEFFEVEVLPNSENQTLLDWYLETYAGVLSTDVHPTVTKGGMKGIVGIDPLEIFIQWGTRIFVLRYDLNGEPFVNYRQTFEMMKNSLELTSIPNLPDTAEVSS